MFDMPNKSINSHDLQRLSDYLCRIISCRLPTVAVYCELYFSLVGTVTANPLLGIDKRNGTHNL